MTTPTEPTLARDDAELIADLRDYAVMQWGNGIGAACARSASRLSELSRAEAQRADLARRLADMGRREERMREALKWLVYETTHLSPMEDNGDHKCRISRAALARARAALAPDQNGRGEAAEGGAVHRCNCPHEVRSGCTDPDCIHALNPAGRS